MSDDSDDFTGMQNAGLFVFVIFCGLPALEMTGFGFGMDISLSAGLICAAIGGAVGGMLLCSRPLMAGLIGGLAAGPLGLLAVYFYTQHREEIWNVELVLVQLVASAPGFGLGMLLKKVLSDSEAE